MGCSHSNAYIETGLVVLVGTTGAGKSTLGNLLVDPIIIKDPSKNEIFPTKGAGGACTTDVTLKEIVDDASIKVMDTPGFDESETQDIKNSLNILKILRNAGEIKAVIYVHSSRTGENFRKLLEYIRVFFTDKVLKKNLIIVYTGISSSDYDIAKRKTNGECINTMLKNTQETVKNVLNIDREIPIVSINSRPTYFSSDEWSTTLSARNNILRIIKSMHPVGVSQLRFAKTESIYRKHKMEAVQRETQIASLYGVLENLKYKCDTLKNEEQELTKYINNECKELDDINADLEQINNYNLVETGSAANYGNHKVEITVFTGYDIAKVDIDLRDDEDGYRCDLTSDKKGVVAVLKASSGIFGRTGGTVTCYAYSCVKHASTISYLTSKMEVKSKCTEDKLCELEERKATLQQLVNHDIPKVQLCIDTETKNLYELLDLYIDFDKALNIYATL